MQELYALRQPLKLASNGRVAQKCMLARVLVAYHSGRADFVKRDVDALLAPVGTGDISTSGRRQSE